jgi:UDP-glucose 4-epimerase
MSRLVIVTGARGAIGRHVVTQLAASGDRVLGLGHGAHEPGLETIDWINGAIDAANLSALAAKWGRPDAIIHLAGGAAVGPSLVSPAEDFERTASTGVRLLEWTRTAAPQSSLVLASSAAVYGAARADFIREDAPRAPCSPYGVHKAVLEMTAASWASNFGVRVAIVRLFSVYGPQLRKQLIFEQAGRLLAGQQQLSLGGTGLETRDWLYIGDAARMLIEAIDLADATAPAFNGCAGISTTISDTITTLARAAGVDVELRFSGLARAGDPAHLVGDQQKATAAGLAARVPLEEGFVRTLDWVARERERTTPAAQLAR